MLIGWSFPEQLCYLHSSLDTIPQIITVVIWSSKATGADPGEWNPMISECNVQTREGEINKKNACLLACKEEEGFMSRTYNRLEAENNRNAYAWHNCVWFPSDSPFGQWQLSSSLLSVSVAMKLAMECLKNGDSLLLLSENFPKLKFWESGTCFACLHLHCASWIKWLQIVLAVITHSGLWTLSAQYSK